MSGPELAVLMLVHQAAGRCHEGSLPPCGGGLGRGVPIRPATIGSRMRWASARYPPPAFGHLPRKGGGLDCSASRQALLLATSACRIRIQPEYDRAQEL